MCSWVWLSKNRSEWVSECVSGGGRGGRREGTDGRTDGRTDGGGILVRESPCGLLFTSGELCKTSTVDNSYAVPCTEKKYQVKQTLWPDHCVIDTVDAKFHPRIRRLDTDIVVRKGFRCHVRNKCRKHTNNLTATGSPIRFNPRQI